MQNLLRRFLSVLTIAGSVCAVFLIGSQLLSLSNTTIGHLLVMMYVAIAFWGIWAGILLLENSPQAYWHNVRFWACQIPVIFIPGIGHKLGIGMFLFAWIELPLKFAFFYGIGTVFKFKIFDITGPVIFGVNIVAIVLAVLAYKIIPHSTNQASS